MAGKIKDLTGQKFGRLTALNLSDITNKRTNWLCRCDCGNTKIVRSDMLQNGNTLSCGCLKKEMDKTLCGKVSHGMFGSRLYTIWNNMKRRCHNSRNPSYKYYGKRGIIVCDEWQGFDPFMKWALSNGYSEKLTLDRINNNGSYEPSNCRWTTMKEQCNNRRTGNRYKHN